MESIYLDNCSTTPLRPAVAAAMAEAHRAGYANPASQHCFGREAHRRIEAARDQIALSLGCELGSAADQVIFTSGGTEANNLALRGLLDGRPGRLLVSAGEHPSILRTAELLSTHGIEVRQIPLDFQGVIRLDALAELITDDTRLVSVQMCNHETGVLQPVAQVVQICSLRGVPVHCDAVQAVGKLPVNFNELELSLMTVAPHKFHGPRGIGALVIRAGCELQPLLFGGFQQSGLRPGTESVELAIGFETALLAGAAELPTRSLQIQRIRDRFERRLHAELAPVSIHGAHSPRLPHVTNVAFAGVDRQALLIALDLAGVACSTGSACASGSSEPSPVLRAMGVSAALVSSSLRFSFGALTTDSEVVLAEDRIIKSVNNLRRR